MKQKWYQGMAPNLKLFVVISLLLGLASGLGDGVLSNYFNESYHVTAEQRGFIEFPRELPGALLVLITALGALLGNYRLAVVAQILAATGMMLLGLLHPSFGVMCIFLSLNALGTHLYMPLQDTITLDQVGSQNSGTWLGRFTGMRTGMSMLAGLFIFFGFRYWGLNYNTPVEVFLLAALCYVAAALLFVRMLANGADTGLATPKVRLVFRKRYLKYYILCILNGVHKQIYMVFGAWVLIELFQQKTDVMAILGVIGSAIGVAFVPALGKLVDKLGVKKMMYIESIGFFVIYIGYAIAKDVFSYGTALLLCVLFYLINRMTMQFGVVRTVYIRNIAVQSSDIMPTLSMGISLDHVFTIIAASACGYLWDTLGHQWVFLLAAAFSVFNVIIAIAIKKQDAFPPAEESSGA
jgi:MFS family permease